MRFTIFQDSRLGDRDGNEDRVGYSYSRDVLLMTVADGMGGHLGGEVAAEIAITEITRRFQNEARHKLRKPFDFLVSAIQSAHRAIVSHAVEQNLLECPRTTVVACIVQNGNAYWAHAGDSRLYVLRKGQMIARTQDHSRVQMMIDAGEITPEAAARHPERNKIFSCLGGVVPPQIASGREFPLVTGDTVMLSTDGFWGQIPGNILGGVIQKQPVVEVMPGLLEEAQRRARGESDNLSVVAMTWESQDDAGVADTQQLGVGFTTSSNTTEQLEGKGGADADVTEEDIERAINEIQDAIRRVPR
ncbi:MAG TPA: protein phosphatase 2C domain-containing protein [Usitatibacter sp.]|jgi:serine/threonine protein phosphatase PrpC|nr:protein phosphatase 2C domain-containing protein [Usitatibacter sp.]